VEIIKVEKSNEICAEINWHSYDIFFDEQMDKKFIFSLKKFGTLMYLSLLKKPFFKVNTNEYLIKGTQYNTKLRVGIFNNNIEYLSFILENILILY
jgi:hypothetical protein